jgi:hypothetical protein
MHTLDANEITIVAKDPDAKMRRVSICMEGAVITDLLHQAR